MFDPITIQSHRGPYRVTFAVEIPSFLEWSDRPFHILIDANVHRLHAARLAEFSARAKSVTIIDATESQKDARKALDVAERLAEHGLKRTHRIIAIGGGIVQDITCFLASTMLRGVPWCFIPTTLLAQADSCIGSKSSINLGRYKNILGTFAPPELILIASDFRKTLDDDALRSGIGEIIKVHALAGSARLDELASSYHALAKDESIMSKAVLESLTIKKAFIEIDEFDQGARNLLNYGHSFGHAIESATKFGIPHGIAVTIGMDMANFISWKLGTSDQIYFEKYHELLSANSSRYAHSDIPLSSFMNAITKDKKNTDAGLVLILPKHNGTFEKTIVNDINVFNEGCSKYLLEVRKQVRLD